MFAPNGFFLRRVRILGAIVAMPLAGPGSGAATAEAVASKSETAKSSGTEYVDARAFARRFGLTTEWTEPQKKVRLHNARTSIELTVDSLDARIDGVRVFLGEPAVLRNASLHLARTDVEALLTPILAPHPAPRPQTLKTIVIDAGHGGNDRGNRNPRLKIAEKDFTLDVALRLAPLLRRQGFNVVLTRHDDRRVELDERTEIAWQARADLFVSIHFNAFTQERVAGTETFVMPPRFQRSTPQAETDQALVATDFSSNKFDHWNAVLGHQMHRQLTNELKLTDRGLKRFRYRVLCLAQCPAVLVEAGFLSNDAEGRKISAPEYRQQIAEAIAAGVSAYGAILAVPTGATPVQ
ncbi:MAG: N-acetylmuramoyl-L-alanine amidase [Opitutaceae bacterium]